jgi:hypothetical protein
MKQLPQGFSNDELRYQVDYPGRSAKLKLTLIFSQALSLKFPSRLLVFYIQ